MKLTERERIIIKRIKDRQRNFEQMNNIGQRRALAKDVIDALASGELTTKTGGYMSALHFPRRLRMDGAQTDLQKLFSVMPKGCSVCALGGLFVCMVKRADRLKTADIGVFQEEFGPGGKNEYGIYNDGNNLDIEGSKMKTRLEDVFTWGEITDIEFAFECWIERLKNLSGSQFYDVTLGKVNWIDRLHKKNRGNRTKVMATIMQHILNNPKARFEMGGEIPDCPL